MKTPIAAQALIAAVCLWPAGSMAQLTDSNGVDLLQASTVYTLTNLHPDEERARLYAVNFQQPGLIPRCTEVRITRLRRKNMRFVVVDRDKEYEYINHDAAAEPFNDHLLRFFGTECDPAAVEQLSDADQEGIRSGKASPGMSRQGVIYALGFPPRHVNPSIESGDWMYWRHRFDRFEVQFDENGLVDNVMN